MVLGFFPLISSPSIGVGPVLQVHLHPREVCFWHSSDSLLPSRPVLFWQSGPCHCTDGVSPSMSSWVDTHDWFSTLPAKDSDFYSREEKQYKMKRRSRSGSVTHFTGFGIKEAAVVCDFSVWTRGQRQRQWQQADGRWVVLEGRCWRHWTLLQAPATLECVQQEEAEAWVNVTAQTLANPRTWQEESRSAPGQDVKLKEPRKLQAPASNHTSSCRTFYMLRGF